MGDRYMADRNADRYRIEENKTVFDHIAQVFTTYGVMVVVFLLFDICVGDLAKGYSTLFELGSAGLTAHTLLQLLFLAVTVTVSQIVFMTDTVIRNMKIISRNVLFISSICIAVVAFVFAFGWFPVYDIAAWIGFVISFSVSMTASLFITRFIEKTENKKMQDALDKYNGAGSR